MVIYLHGFASSPRSGKASYFAARFAAAGIPFEGPDLNLPDFSTLTVTRMLDQTRALIERAGEPVTLMGSSLGGYVAVNAAAQWPDRVKSVVLMAPALDFSDTGLSGPGGAAIADWKRTGRLNVFHFAYGRMMPIHYELYEDARRYDAMKAVLPMPVLIFQGLHDTAVPASTVTRWAEGRPNVELHLLDDDHQLGRSVDFMWETLKAFLEKLPPRQRL